jgi:hypothetical protein
MTGLLMLSRHSYSSKTPATPNSVYVIGTTSQKPSAVRPPHDWTFFDRIEKPYAPLPSR